MCQLNTDPMKSQIGYLDVVGKIEPLNNILPLYVLSFRFFFCSHIYAAPPDIVDYQTSHDIVVQEGETVNLTCSAVGSPEPTIKWRKEKHRSLLSIENKESN